MTGLLDFFGNGWDDPKSNAVMALAGGLLDGDFAGGMKGYAGVMAGAKDAQFKRAMQQAQMDNLASEIDARKLAGVKYADQQKLIESVFGGKGIQNKGTGVGEVPFPTGGMSTENGAIGAPLQSPQGSRNQGGSVLGNMRPDDVARLKLGGLDLTDIYKFANEPKKLDQGSTYVDRNTLQERFMPKVGEGMMPNQQGVYGFAPGYAEAQAQFEGAKTRAIEDAKAGYSLQEKTLAGGQPVVGTTSQLINAVNQGGNPFLPKGESPARMPSGNSEAQIIANGMGGLNGLPTVARGGNVSFKSTPQEMDAPRILQDAFNESSTRYAAAQKAGDSVNMNRERVNMEGIRGEYSKLGNRAPSLAPNQAPNTAPQSAPSFGLQLQSQQEKDALKISNENIGKVNDSWIKTSYEPLIASKDAHMSTINNVASARNSIEGLGGTGWGTEAKANAANILTGLGIGGKNAEMYAGNAQVFQREANRQIQAGLSVQKGVQTKEDAQREADTFAQLKNTTKANAYILDSAQALAEQNLLKAEFYQKAMPIASKKGDLQEIDRAWAERAPSFFSMPSMKKWAKK
jgi:hypothetical protein